MTLRTFSKLFIVITQIFGPDGDCSVRACERAPAVGGLVFLATNDFTESVEDILSNLVRISGAQGPYELREPTNRESWYALLPCLALNIVSLSAWEDALAITSPLRPYLARSLLGWQPRKPSLVEGLSFYYAAWKATN
jgi:nucleoside-diphosphate-sugar epimerase